ncbi:type II toxin-antitoxin system VapB family antitoxin [Methylobacterium sp. sgz302541]|uniref:type II toxin-antitoxin system VapB family antitoxin n=1 Tax=unclassified Methylobacterium TaxID=2615210 RepID=UPI003D3578BC
MTKQLNVRNDEAYALAHEIAGRLGEPVSETVLRALRELGQRMPSDKGLNPTQKADLDAIRALVREAQKHRVPGVGSDHGHLYDEDGLPV